MTDKDAEDRKLKKLRAFLQKMHGVLRFSRFPERDLIGKTLLFQSGDCVLVARIRAVELDACFSPSCRLFLDLPLGYRFNAAVVNGYEVECFAFSDTIVGVGFLKLKETPLGGNQRSGRFWVY